MRLSFEWDEEKAGENRRKHKVSFEEGITVFNDPFSLTIGDPDHSGDEQRYVDIGASDKGRVLVVSYTERGRSIRLTVAARRHGGNGDNMRKALSETTQRRRNGMRAEYDFTAGTRGKHYRAMQAGYTITIRQSDGTTVVKEVEPRKDAVVLAPDVREYFPDSESVNTALRSLIKLIPEKRDQGPKRAGGAETQRLSASRSRSRTTEEDSGCP